MYRDTPGPYCSKRLFEWAMALAMTLFGFHVMMLPGTMTQSRYSGVLLIFPIWMFALMCAAVGMTRTVALAHNGNWPEWGPRIRAVAALCSSVLWAQLAVSLAQYHSPGMWVYLILAVAELRSVWRARRDAHGSRYQ